MSCFYPMSAFFGNDGKVKFGPNFQGENFFLPCGQCSYCRMNRAREWSIRCVHEAVMHEHTCFITLTYAPEHLPYPPSLDHRHFQLFMKRLRKEFSCGVTLGGVNYKADRIRYYMCGEYGPTRSRRPHYHAVLFGCDFLDKRFFKLKKGYDLFVSPFLEKVWGKGFCTVGELNINSAGYCARYSQKKVTGKKADEHYRWCGVNGEEYQLMPEYAKMSNRDGIGADWIRRYMLETYPSDNVVVTSKKGRFALKPPRYYDKLLQRYDEDLFDEIKRRRREALKGEVPPSEDRLMVKKMILDKNLKKLVRELEQGDTSKVVLSVQEEDLFAPFTPKLIINEDL